MDFLLFLYQLTNVRLNVVLMQKEKTVILANVKTQNMFLILNHLLFAKLFVVLILYLKNQILANVIKIISLLMDQKLNAKFNVERIQLS